MIRFGIILMLVCLVASTILAVTYKVTYPKIIAQKDETENNSLRAIFPSSDDFKNTGSYYIAYKNNGILGYIIKIYAQGYAAPIEMLVGIEQEGIITRVTILDQKETPGLGAKINEIRPPDKEPWFLKQFKGKKAADLSFSNIDAITGATISSRAVMETVKNSVGEFLNNLNIKNQ